MTHRFFRAAPAVYESLRLQIDAAWGYPTPHTLTSIPPAAHQNKDSNGNCIIAVRLVWLDWEPVATLVPQAVASGKIEEISEADYWAAIPQSGPGD